MYIEPTVFETNNRGDILLAGAPSLILTRDERGKPDLVTDSIFGMILGADRRKRVVPAPIDAKRVADIRASPREDGSWAFAFAELERSQKPGETSRVAHLWYGVHDGSIWSSLERLPLPAKWQPEPYYSSALVQRGDTVAWAVRVTEQGRAAARVAFFERRGGRWSYEILSDGIRPDYGMTSVPAYGTAYVALAHSDTLGFVLAIVQSDYVFTGAVQKGEIGRSDAGSLFLFVRRSEWEPLRRVVFGSRDGEAHHPSLSLSRAGDALTWWAEVTGPAGTRREARTMLGNLEERNERVIPLDSTILWSNIPLAPEGGMRLWVTDHIAPSGLPDREIRFVGVTSEGESQLLGSIPNPYTGLFFNATSPAPSEVLISSAVIEPADSMLYSLLLRARIECSAHAQ